MKIIIFHYPLFFLFLELKPLENNPCVQASPALNHLRSLSVFGSLKKSYREINDTHKRQGVVWSGVGILNRSQSPWTREEAGVEMLPRFIVYLIHF